MDSSSGGLSIPPSCCKDGDEKGTRREIGKRRPVATEGVDAPPCGPYIPPSGCVVKDMKGRKNELRGSGKKACYERVEGDVLTHHHGRKIVLPRRGAFEQQRQDTHHQQARGG